MSDHFTRARADLAGAVAATDGPDARRAVLEAGEAELVAALGEVHEQLMALRGHDPDHPDDVAEGDVEEAPDGRPAAGQVSRVPVPDQD